MYLPNIDHHVSSMSLRHIGLKVGCLGLVVKQTVYLERLFGVGISGMTKSFAVQALPFLNFQLIFVRFQCP
jgi:hypothetical protein